MLRNELSCLIKMFAQNMHQNGFYQTTSSAKKSFSFWGLRPPDLLPSFILQQNLILPSHQIITNDFSWMWGWAVEPFCWLFQIIASNLHQNKWFQDWFFKNFLGRGSPSPLPRPLPRFFSGFALGLGFALNSRALRALDSGFALNFRLEILVWPPPK